MSYPVMLGAIVITTANRTIRFIEGAGPANSALLDVGTWYLRGDGAPTDFCLKLKNALEAAGASTNTYTVTVSMGIDPSTAHTVLSVARASGTDTFGILWSDAATTFDKALAGFTASTANDSTTKSSTIACAANWVSNDIAREIEPYSERTVAVPRAVSGRVQGVTRSSRMQSWRLGLAFVDIRRMLVADALAGTQDTLEGFMERFGANAAFELHEQPTVSTTTLAALSSSTLVDTCHFSEDSLSRFEPTRLGPGVQLYSLDLRLHRKV